MTETRSTLGLAVDQCIDGLQAQLRELKERLKESDRHKADAERLAAEVRELKERNRELRLQVNHEHDERAALSKQLRELRAQISKPDVQYHLCPSCCTVSVKNP